MLPRTGLKVKYLCLSLAVVAGLVAALAGERDISDFCAVQLTVTTARDNQPVLSAVAELTDNSGRVVQAEEIVGGQGRFCDFGFGRYSILVHYKDSRCGAAEIKDVHVIYGLTQKLKAVLNKCADEGEYGPGNGCFFYVRVSAADGRPLKGVEIKSGVNGGVAGGGAHTDSYGRVGLLVHERTRSDFTFLRPGYQPKHLLLACPSALEPEKEVSVVLEPEKPPKAR